MAPERLRAQDLLDAVLIHSMVSSCSTTPSTCRASSCPRACEECATTRNLRNTSTEISCQLGQRTPVRSQASSSPEPSLSLLSVRRLNRFVPPAIFVPNAVRNTVLVRLSQLHGAKVDMVQQLLTGSVTEWRCVAISSWHQNPLQRQTALPWKAFPGMLCTHLRPQQRPWPMALIVSAKTPSPVSRHPAAHPRRRRCQCPAAGLRQAAFARAVSSAGAGRITFDIIAAGVQVQDGGGLAALVPR